MELGGYVHRTSKCIVGCHTFDLRPSFFLGVILDISAVRLNGANYTYLLQFSSKFIAVLGASATLLDAIVTASASAATAAAYLSAEFKHFPMHSGILGLLILVVLTLVSLLSVRESSRVTLSFTILHVNPSFLIWALDSKTDCHRF